MGFLDSGGMPYTKLKDRQVVPVAPDAVLLDAPAVARMLSLSLQTLANQRSARVGLPFVRVGRSIRYRREDVERYIASLRPVRVREGR